jgi:23S rRNA (cytidine2498-2'-O)-methyltransferase
VLLEHLADFPVCGSLWLEVVDTNDGKELSTFCRKFECRCARPLEKAGRLVDDASKPRLLLTFISGREVFSAWPSQQLGDVADGHPAPEVPPRGAQPLDPQAGRGLAPVHPARAVGQRLHDDMTGVDLGAAPGGWTYQLVKRGMLVTAIDNGPMAESLMDTGLVQHLMADGFTWKPKQPVDWMVCDIVEKPRAPRR